MDNCLNHFNVWLLSKFEETDATLQQIFSVYDSSVSDAFMCQTGFKKIIIWFIISHHIEYLECVDVYAVRNVAVVTS